jgi:hypothetical protein
VVRRLFFLEFRRAVTPFVLFALASWGALSIAELWFAHHIKQPVDIHTIIDGFMLSIVVVIAFPAGARAFSKEFKETHFLFLQSLPLTRQRAWAVLVLANLSASLLSVAVFFVLRPSLLQGLGDPEKARQIVGWTFLAYCLFFCAGCCFSPLFVRPIFSYLSGFLVTTAVVIESLLIAFYLGSDARSALDLPVPLGNNIDDLFLVVAWALVCMVYLLLSLRFYVLGEFNLFRTQVRNNLRLASSLAILFLFLIACVNAGVFAAFDTWEVDWYGYGDEWGPTNGKQVLVFERRTHHPQFARIHILDLRTGALVGSFEHRGLAFAGWSSGNDGLAVLVREDSPLYRVGYLLPGSDQLLGLSPDARELHNTRFLFSRIHALEPLAGGRTLLVVESGESGKIEILDPSNGELKELGGGYLDGWAWNLPVKNGNLIWFRNVAAPTRVWRVGSEIRELTWASSPEPESDWACVIEGLVYKTTPACVRAVAKLYPFYGEKVSSNQPREGEGWYVHPAPRVVSYNSPRVFDLDSTGKPFYLQQDPTTHQGRLFVFPGPQQSWRLIGQDIPLRSASVPAAGSDYFFPSFSSSLQVDLIKGLVVFYVQKGNKVTGFLYDAGLGKTIEVGELELPPAPQEAWIRMNQFPGMKSVVIVFQKNSTRGFEGFTFKYAPQSGIITRIPPAVWHNQGFMIHMDEDGNLAYSVWNPYRIFSVSADQKERQLWPPPGK